MESADGWLLITLALPWVGIALMQGGGRLGKGNTASAWVWLIPAAISVALALLVMRGAGTDSSVLTLLNWLPEQGIRLGLQVDGLSLFFGLVVAGMGTLIFIYTAGYFSDDPAELRRFYTYLLFFLGAMLGTVFSSNLLMLYVWWEMTGLASFFLIGYLHNDLEARKGARMALVTTIATGMCMLAGILLIGLTAGTFEINELVVLAPKFADEGTWQAGFLLILLGAFGKSAQFPFHYWLPNAMAAPTPVSAYLHSATMVKLGVFLVARIFPIFRPLESWAPILILIGFFTFLLGATFSLLSYKLKAILAFSTVSQLGFLIGFYGMSPASGAHYDFLHIINHVFYKGALFMVVGIIDHATGIKDIRQLGGLRRRMPLLFVITAISAASMAGVILTSGFLSKEYMLKEKLDYMGDGALLAYYPILMVVVGSIFKVAFSLRLVLHSFCGREPEAVGAHFHKPSFLIQFSPLVLTSLTLVTGILPGVMSSFLNGFRVAGLHAPEDVKLKLWHGWTSPAFMISCSILVAGFLLYRIAERTQWRWAKIPDALRLDLAFDRGMEALPAAGARITRWLGVEHPKFHLPVVLVVGLLWVAWPLSQALGAVSLPVIWEEGLFTASIAGLMIVAAGFYLLFVKSWKGQVILIGVIGFLVTFYFVLYRAPDLALTQILVEAATLILLLVLFQRFPILRNSPRQLSRRSSSVNVAIATGFGILMFTLTLLFAGRRPLEPLGDAYLSASLPMAKGTNAVNTILVDFRGFDTLLEIGVLVIATLGILGLLLRRRQGGDTHA